MADPIVPPAAAAAIPAAAPQTPIVTLPSVSERQTVPSSALGLETELPEHLKIPARKDDLALPPGPTGPAAGTPTVVPATGPASPVAIPATGTPAIGASAPAAPATGPAAPEPKVKLGGKEYTTKELEKILADRANQNNQPAPAPAPAPAAVVPETKEQIAEREKVWCEKLIKDEAVSFPATEAEMETLLGGGKEAVAFFTSKLSEVASRAVLLARKSVYADLNPQMQAFADRIAPLFMNHQQVERISTEQAFLHAFPEYKGQHVETARQVAEALIERYPEHVQKMNQGQFLAAVNEQTDRILQTEYKRWNPSATDTWRDASKRESELAARVAAEAAAAAAGTPPAPAPAPAPAAQPDPWKQAPAAHSPASTPAAPAADWNKGVAKSLQD